MKSEQFNTGNFNEWERLVNETLPNVNSTIRHDIIPRIDAILTSMLGGYNSVFSKENIDVSQIYENGSIRGITCSIEYVVDDFQVPNAPKEAIQTDCDAIKNALGNEIYEVKSIEIHTDSGKLDIEFEILFEDNEDDEARTSEEQHLN